MTTQKLKIVNGRVVTPAGILPGAQVLVENGKIVAISQQNLEVSDAVIIDAEGRYVAPGIIDTHIHGGGGVDFLEATPDAFYTVAKAHAAYGITALYPTIAAHAIETFYKAIDSCEEVMKDSKDGAQIMGLHLEGNYLNPIMKGGQFSEHIYAPDPNEYKALLKRTDCIKRWSAAPELEGGLDFGRYASEHGVIVSIAHTVANYPMVQKAFDAGYRHVTHFYNAMTGVHKEREYKHEGTIESIYLIDDITVELIADGIHVPPTILKLVHKIKGAGRIVLVTDAMRAAAWPDAATKFKDPYVILEDGVGKLHDRSALSSSLATGDRLIRVMVHQAGIPLEDAVRMSSETPARIMGIADRKGTLEKGKDADIILFDDDINIDKTIVGGKIVYSKY